MTDPAFDLADSILSWRLSCDEEKALLQHYIEASGDTDVSDRLLINKLIAGIRARDAAAASLTDPRLLNRHEEFNRDYITASNFLVLHTMRYFAELCCKPNKLSWHAPLVALDVDGVMDKQVIGFPSTTWAGIQAVSLLHAHDFAVVLNTARSIPEVKEYCKHYGFLGGVAEYGAYVWDALTDREQILVTPESMDQLCRLSDALRHIPGIFVNDDYKFSIRTYTFDGEATRAVPGLLIQNLISKLGLDRLHFHQTYTDTAVLANETDKGKGLLALLDLVGQRDLLGAAVGDSEADLAMFSIAKSSFAPGHISCRSQACAIGCKIDSKPFQPGLLNIVRRMVHPNNDFCRLCASIEVPERIKKNLVFQVLQHADESRFKRLARSIFHSTVVKSFLAN
jgi:hydroxymethylpyrimidine pyrophosphatase-like HAD family hydrolase